MDEPRHPCPLADTDAGKAVFDGQLNQGERLLSVARDIHGAPCRVRPRRALRGLDGVCRVPVAAGHAHRPAIRRSELLKARHEALIHVAQPRVLAPELIGAEIRVASPVGYQHAAAPSARPMPAPQKNAAHSRVM